MDSSGGVEDLSASAITPPIALERVDQPFLPSAGLGTLSATVTPPIAPERLDQPVPPSADPGTLSTMVTPPIAPERLDQPVPPSADSGPLSAMVTPPIAPERLDQPVPPSADSGTLSATVTPPIAPECLDRPAPPSAGAGTLSAMASPEPDEVRPGPQDITQPLPSQKASGGRTPPALPPGASKWLKDLYVYLTVDLGPEWDKLMSLFIEHERLAGFPVCHPGILYSNLNLLSPGDSALP